jgi:hypothetical protein
MAPGPDRGIWFTELSGGRIGDLLIPVPLPTLSTSSLSVFVLLLTGADLAGARRRRLSEP